ncbi:MAG: ATP-binding cassette domain-containing protein [Candidatus Paceibacterota bacterium]|jgi:ABC-type polysaccharide/polyol phosphate transport system ATPase subunit
MSEDRKKRIVASFISKSFAAAHRDDRNMLAKILGFWKKKGKKNVQALLNISLEVKEGEVLGIIGRNGSGKSTLLRLIAGIYKPDNGSIETTGDLMYINGFNHGIKPRLTMRENIYLAGAIMGLKSHEVRQRLDDIVSFSGLGEFLDAKVRQFSSGMKSRLSFSVFIHCAAKRSPDILLLDEVMGAGGDLDFHSKAGEKMKELIKGGAAAILTSHNLQDILQYCDRAIWIEEGIIKGSGKPSEVIEIYRNFIQKS